MKEKNTRHLFVSATIIFACVILSIPTVGQPPTLWSRCYGGPLPDIANDVCQTLDGGYILVGFSDSNGGDVSGNHGSRDIWVVKTDDNGTLQWQKSLGGSLDEEGTSIKQSADGSFYIAGYTNSNDSNVSGNHGGSDVWVVKLDTIGNIIWQKALGGTLEDIDYADPVIKIEVTSDGGCIVGSTTNSNNGDVSGNHGNMDCWLVKLDDTGTILWQRCYGGSFSETLKDLRLTTDGGFILVGQASSLDGDLTGQNYSMPFTSWIVKTDSLGSIQWQSVYLCIDTISNCNGQVNLNSILPLQNGSYVAAGTIYFYGYVYYYSTVNVSSTGTVSGLYYFTYQQSQFHNSCKSIQSSLDGGFILSGQTDDTYDDIYIYKTGTSGTWDFIWDTLSVNYESVGTTIQSSDGGFVIAGCSQADLSCGGAFDPYQFRLIKLGGIVSVPDQSNTEKWKAYFSNSNTLTVSFISNESSDMNLAVYDMEGRILHSQSFQAHEGRNEKDFFTNILSKGIYLVKVNDKKSEYCFKVVKN
jgi:hypothetical protein